MRILLLASLIVALPATVLSQYGADHDSSLVAIEHLYTSGHYGSAELEARRLFSEPMLTDSVKIECEKWIAFSLIAQEKKDLARDQFIAIFSLNPDFDLDPVLTSPKILAVFNDARSLYRTRVNDNGTPEQRPVVFKSPEPVSFRTIVFPGWEQVHRGKDTKGYIFIAAGAAALGSGIAFEKLRADARTEYLHATVPSDIATKYDRYNTMRKAEYYSFISFAVIYLVSEIDVFSDTVLEPETVSSSFPYPAHPLLSVSIAL